jgi:hypothetical protein
MANCEGLKMPVQQASSHPAKGSSCCQISQTSPKQLLQISWAKQLENYAPSNAPSVPLLALTQSQVLNPRFVVASPPDRQSLLCTLLI